MKVYDISFYIEDPFEGRGIVSFVVYARNATEARKEAKRLHPEIPVNGFIIEVFD